MFQTVRSLKAERQLGVQVVLLLRVSFSTKGNSIQRSSKSGVEELQRVVQYSCDQKLLELRDNHYFHLIHNAKFHC